MEAGLKPITDDNNPIALTMDDWRQLAVPAPGRSEMFARLSTTCGLAPAAPPARDEPAIFDGQVAVRHLTWSDGFQRDFPPAPLDHPNIARAVDLLRCWPEACAEMGAVLNAFSPVLMLGEVNETDLEKSNSHQPPGMVGAMWATVHNPLFLAQAFVHEMAHNKLFALGQHLEQSGPLFTNGQDALFDSPVRLDIPRPISAVFHGVYAFTHVLALDLKMLAADPGNERVRGLCRYNARRVARGLYLVQKCARWTTQGQAFFDGFRAWAWDQVTRGLRIGPPEQAAEHGPLVLIGPPGGGKSTLARGMTERHGTPVILAGDECWQVWWQTPVVQRKALTVFGSRQVLDLLAQRDQLDPARLIANWLNEGRFSAPELDMLKLYAIAAAIEDCADGIVEVPAEYCLFSVPEANSEFHRLVAETRSRVVLVRPITDTDHAKKLLIGRARQFGHAPRPEVIHRSLHDQIFRELGTYVLDTDTMDHTQCLDWLRAIQAGREEDALVKINHR